MGIKNYSDIPHHTEEFLSEELIKIVKSIDPEKLAAVVSNHASNARIT